ncbi:serine/arginine repetitive matrix protein 2 [Hyalella azteca]|uniref:Serine/arginine repetitive matrix protein 2 n=1 Tax=Hyalella azteca TaxID=294128 RepID=A0A8B7NER8_HYAAZ|nr:serine/arginine repetitive matrix protein 2 [Hyalella azteca]
MNSMHNSFGGGGGGYSSPYPGYMPPSALPYYNGYPADLASQAPSAYYGKSPAAMAGYSAGMAGYSTPNLNNSMYYQQYGLGYQYGYGKYALGAGLTPTLGYGSELGGAASIAPSSLGGLQAPTTDLGLTGSMFSKGSGSSGSSNNKYSALGNSSPHSLLPSHTNSSMSAAIAPSHSPHSLSSSLRGHIATPSPPVDHGDCKKDLDKMRRCQLCGQVFRLMSECLAHMKAVHEAPMSMYGVPHSSHTSQSLVPPHMATHSPGRPSSLSNAPDSPLMALERMGWGKDQNVMPSLHSSSPLSQTFGASIPSQQSMSSHQLNMISNSHLPDPRYGDPSQQSAKRLNDFYNSCTNQTSSHQDHQSVIEQSLHHASISSSFKSRKSSSYSVSSIIGESSDNRHDRRDMLERGGIGSVDPPQTHSPSLPPSLTPNLPITSTPNLPPNLSPNLPPHIHQSYSSSVHLQSSQPPQLAPNTPSIPQHTNHSSHMHLTPPSLSPSYGSQTATTSVHSPHNHDAYHSHAPISEPHSSTPITNSNDVSQPIPNSYHCSSSYTENDTQKDLNETTSHQSSTNRHALEECNANQNHNTPAHLYQPDQKQIVPTSENSTRNSPIREHHESKSPYVPPSCEADESQCQASSEAATNGSQERCEMPTYDQNEFKNNETDSHGIDNDVRSLSEAAHSERNKKNCTKAEQDISETSAEVVDNCQEQSHDEAESSGVLYSQPENLTTEVSKESNAGIPALSNFNAVESHSSQEVRDEIVEGGSSVAADDLKEASAMNEDNYSRAEDPRQEPEVQSTIDQEDVSSSGMSNHLHDDQVENDAPLGDNLNMSEAATEQAEYSHATQYPCNNEMEEFKYTVYTSENERKNTSPVDNSQDLSAGVAEVQGSTSSPVNPYCSTDAEQPVQNEGIAKGDHNANESKYGCEIYDANKTAMPSERDSLEHKTPPGTCRSVPDESANEEVQHPSAGEEDIGDEDEPGDPRHNLQDSSASPGSNAHQASWPSTPTGVHVRACPSPQMCKNVPPPPATPPQSSVASPHHSEQLSPYQQQYYGQQQKSQGADYNDKTGLPHQSPSKQQQPGPYRGSWPAGYPSTGNSNSGGSSAYGYHQQQYASQQNCGASSPMMSPQSGSPNNKIPGASPYPSHSRYPNQYIPSGFDNRRPMPNSYSGQGHWYPGPGRGDGKSAWPSWSSPQAQGYSQSYYYGSNAPGNCPVAPHPSPSVVKYPLHQTSPLSLPLKPRATEPPVVSPQHNLMPINEPPKSSGASGKKREAHKQENLSNAKSTSNVEKPRKKRARPGPKSKVDHKDQQPLPQSQPQIEPPVEDKSLQDTSTSQPDGVVIPVNADVLTPPTTSVESSDSSDTDVDESPKLAVLKPAKRFRGPDGSFVGPKRVKLAKMVRQRQHTRQKLIEDQIKQSELEEQLTQQWVEMASEQEGPLANVLLKSSLLLEDQNVDEPEAMEERIATMTAQLQHSDSMDPDAPNSRDKSSLSQSALLALKKPVRKNAGHKVLHNYNSVVIRTLKKEKFVPKLRAKDFKWSHYIKSMRYWCKDCGHGFKNPKESQQHGEEQCKANCLYMLECYVSVTDIVQHKLYGNKVEELLEEYQVDGEHKCGRCGTIVLRKADFLVHLDTHKDFMPWECTICGTRFKIRGSLKEHLRYTHMKGRVPCLKCNKVFPTSTLLRQHVKVHTQHYKYSRTGKHREEDLRMAREAIDDADDASIPSEQLSHEANEYRNWCKLMELNAMKNIATSDLIDANKEGLDACAGELSGSEENNSVNNTSNGSTTPASTIVS